MKKARKRSAPNSSDELARSYRFDYARSKPNRFARALTKDSVVVVLDPDVARVFRSSKSVNSTLRAVMAARAAPKRRARRKS